MLASPWLDLNIFVLIEGSQTKNKNMNLKLRFYKLGGDKMDRSFPLCWQWRQADTLLNICALNCT